jgi:hypothetical protein
MCHEDERQERSQKMEVAVQMLLRLVPAGLYQQRAALDVCGRMC